MWPSFYGEMFSTEVRFSGVAIGTQLGFLVAGFAPTIVTALGGIREGVDARLVDNEPGRHTDFLPDAGADVVEAGQWHAGSFAGV